MYSIRIIGPGRAGRSLAAALTERGWAFAGFLSRPDPVADAAHGVDVLVIATPDDAVAEVASSVLPSDTTTVVHLSGSLGLDVLAPHPLRAAVHPLVPLPNAELGAARLASGVTFAVAGAPLGRAVAASLGGRVVEVADDDRAAYHAAACIAANHVVALLGQVERVAASVGLDLDSFVPLARRRGRRRGRAGRRGCADRSGPSGRLGHAEPPPRRAARGRAGWLPGRCRPGHTPGPARTASGGLTVEVVDTVAGCRRLLTEARSAGGRVGLVPTMGALHRGHLALLERARAECDVVAVSIFVNPLQFGNRDDLDGYPRTLERDLEACAEGGADVAFVPSVAEMYPSWPAPPATTISVRGVADSWEGASRPGHFDGVATVVGKLCTIAGPCRAYFGLKDFQQLAVVRTMTADLCLPVEIVGCPIVRDHDGLALSSRNARLAGDERAAATVLARALAAGRAAVRAGAQTGTAVGDAMRAVVAAEPLAQLDYAVAVDATTLVQVGALEGHGALRLLIAARVGPVRLIDNCDAFGDAEPTIDTIHRADHILERTA